MLMLIGHGSMAVEELGNPTSSSPATEICWALAVLSRNMRR
jgi:hypothetical protein